MKLALFRFFFALANDAGYAMTAFEAISPVTEPYLRSSFAPSEDEGRPSFPFSFLKQLPIVN